MSHALGLTRQVLVFSLNHYECDTNGPHVYTSISYYVLCTEHIYNDPQTSDDIAQFFFRGIARSSLEKLKTSEPRHFPPHFSSFHNLFHVAPLVSDFPRVHCAVHCGVSFVLEYLDEI